ncbi:MAG TPA: WYL domain-containing protein [Rhodanobacteraceae bacterium]
MATGREYDTFKRKLKLLDMLPDQAQGAATVTELFDRLGDEGFTIDRRGVERDLNDLSGMFPLGKRTGKPAGWYWSRHTKPAPLLGMDVETALVYQLLERFVTPLLPRALWERLLPQFAQARHTLRARSSARFAQWNRRVAVDPGDQPLRAPVLDRLVVTAVSTALLESRQLDFDYRKVGAPQTGTGKHHRVAPYGLVLRGRALYLVGGLTLGAHVGKPLVFALHRMTAPTVADEHASIPPEFDLDRDVAGAGAIGIARGGVLCLELRVSDWWAGFLSESRLADDQRMTPIPGTDDQRVTATVLDTEQLRWWLLSLGRNVEVLKPTTLRRWMAAEIVATARRYRKRHL